MKGSALLCLTALGNPEPLYRNTRHNAGINILRLLKQKLCPNLQLKQSSISQHVEYCHDSEQNILILLNKSQYMNLSGHSMIPIWRKLPHDTMHVVIHDELNIPMGKVQLRKPGTSFRGHNGLRDMIKLKGDDKFFKMGIGIDRPSSRDPKIVADYVLGKFTSHELDVLETQSFEKALEHVHRLLI